MFSSLYRSMRTDIVPEPSFCVDDISIRGPGLMHKRGFLRSRKFEVRGKYSSKLALTELAVVSCSFAFFLHIGLDILKASGIASFFFIVADIYHNSLLLSFPRKIGMVRGVLRFFFLTIAWYSLVEFDAILSLIAGFATCML